VGVVAAAPARLPASLSLTVRTSWCGDGGTVTAKMFATLIAVLLGIAFAFGGFGDLAEVVLFGLAGWLVAKVIEGDIDVIDYLYSKTSARRR
jgi:hypothetical protein